MSKKIYLDAPNVGALEKKYLCKAIDTGFISSIGPFVTDFEKKLAQYLHAPGAVATQSGTAALHMALHELKIGRGDEVIVPNLTFVATVNPVLYVGATPIFVDVDLNTWTINPYDIETSITRKTKAIIAVHLYGNPCQMDTIQRIAKKYNLYVIEDATESLGATYGNQLTGTFGDMGCFSFNGNKIITTGGGGMVVGHNSKRLKHIKFLVNQARTGQSGLDHVEIGFNYRMTNIEAAMGLAQMHKLKDFLAQKAKFNLIYRQELSKLNYIQFQESYPMAVSSYWLNCIMFKEKISQSFVGRMTKRGIPVRKVFMPLDNLLPYRRFSKSQYKNSYNIYHHSLCLPSATINSESDIYQVCKLLKKSLQ